MSITMKSINRLIGNAVKEDLSLDKEIVHIMSVICQKLTHARVCLSEILGENNPEEYFRFREIIFDCEEIMSRYCDCAPIKLISGQVDSIVENYNHSKEKIDV